jgi:hypothetical protein
MTASLRTRPTALFAALAALLVSERAPAQMTPLRDLRETSASATFFGITQSLAEYPPAPFAYFSSTLAPLVDNPDPEGRDSAARAPFRSPTSSCQGSTPTAPPGASGSFTRTGPIARFPSRASSSASIPAFSTSSTRGSTPGIRAPATAG